MKRLSVVALAVLGCAAPSPSSAPHEGPVAPAAEAEAARPTATGDRIVLTRYPCYGACPVYDVTVYETGLVRWYGVAHVSRLGAAEATLTEAEVSRVFADWRALDLDLLSKVPTSPAQDAYADSLAGIVDGVETKRWIAALRFDRDESCEDDDVACLTRYDEEERLAELMRHIEQASGTDALAMTDRCVRTLETSMVLGFLVVEAPVGARMEPVRLAKKMLAKDPSHVVRIWGIEDRAGVLLEQVRFHRDALLREGIASERIIAITLPAPAQPPGTWLMGHGGMEVGRADCFQPRVASVQSIGAIRVGAPDGDDARVHGRAVGRGQPATRGDSSNARARVITHVRHLEEAAIPRLSCVPSRSAARERAARTRGSCARPRSHRLRPAG